MNREAATRHRVNRVINYVHANLDGPLDLDGLASVACLSKFHFTRVFQAHCRETPFRYLWRVRRERAARRLVYDAEAAVTDVALGCGFASSQTFSQAFKARFDRSPTSFRSCPVWIPQSWPIAPLSRPPTTDMVRVVRRPAYRVAYIRHFGSYRREAGGISAAFFRLNAWAQARGLGARDLPRIGVCPDNRRITPEAFCSYDACLPVPPEVGEDRVVSIQTIPAGSYAVLPVACPSAELLSHWEWMVSRWRRTSGEGYEPRWCYEVFHPAASGAIGPELGVELCVRLEG